MKKEREVKRSQNSANYSPNGRPLLQTKEQYKAVADEFDVESELRPSMASSSLAVVVSMKKCPVDKTRA